MVRFVLFLVLLAVTPATAQTGGAPTGESRTIVGEIVWVDLPSRLVLIRESVKTTKVKGQPPARQTVAVSVAPDLAVTRGKTTVGLKDLKAKDHVTARYLATPEGAKAVAFRVAEAAAPSTSESAEAPATRRN